MKLATTSKLDAAEIINELRSYKIEPIEIYNVINYLKYFNEVFISIGYYDNSCNVVLSTCTNYKDLILALEVLRNNYKCDFDFVEYEPNKVYATLIQKNNNK